MVDATGRGAGAWLDLSIPLHTGMVHWPDNPPVVIERMSDIGRGDAANVSKLSMGAHTGTHMDAPLHFLPDGAAIDSMALTAGIGRARVIEISDPAVVTPEELARHNPQRDERILLKTRNSARVWANDTFVEDFVYISQAAARALVAAGIQTVGIDYLSVGGYWVDGVETHAALLGAGIWIIEGLNLAPLSAGAYELICLPLRIAGGDGAPARAIARRLAEQR